MCSLRQTAVHICFIMVLSATFACIMVLSPTFACIMVLWLIFLPDQAPGQFVQVKHLVFTGVGLMHFMPMVSVYVGTCNKCLLKSPVVFCTRTCVINVWQKGLMFPLGREGGGGLGAAGFQQVIIKDSKVWIVFRQPSSLSEDEKCGTNVSIELLLSDNSCQCQPACWDWQLLSEQLSVLACLRRLTAAVTTALHASPLARWFLSYEVETLYSCCLYQVDHEFDFRTCSKEVIDIFPHLKKSNVALFLDILTARPFKLGRIRTLPGLCFHCRLDDLCSGSQVCQKYKLQSVLLRFLFRF